VKPLKHDLHLSTTNVRRVAAILEDAAQYPDLLKRLKRGIVSHWVLDKQANSYLHALIGDGIYSAEECLFVDFFLFFKGNFYEIKSDIFGERAAFYKPTGLTDSENAAVQEAFLEAIRIYGGPGQRTDYSANPVFVDTYEKLWRSASST